MEQPRTFRLPRALIMAVMVLWGTVLIIRGLGSGATDEVAWSELVTVVESGQATEVLVQPDRIVASLLEDEASGTRRLASDRVPNGDDYALIETWRAAGLVIRTESEQASWLVSLVAFLLGPLLLLLLLGWMMGRTLRGGVGSALDFGKGKPKILDRALADRVTFDDVAGVDEAKGELREIISFLTDPEKYHDVGAQLPKGTLLVGPPGTGKTLLARAVAGEASVPFFSISGSEFVEMFVGVGASRVRELFDQARKLAPCIVFIDELDAIGKSRGGIAAMGVNEEREQTLNQLLVELDGFDPQTGVVIMAATNRPEVLDAALLRAGRFDRRVVVDRPDIGGRQAILGVHIRRIQLDPEDVRLVARRTPGMVGADLAKVVNEAALAAVRRGAQSVAQCDFDEAVDRIQLGLEQKSRAMSESEKRRVAYHESGHALVAMTMKHADPVHKITIIPRSVGALGATLQLPTEDRYLVTEAELLDRIAVMLGGRAAETLACGDVSTGAENDLERATRTARMMVTRFGMSDALGLATTEGGASAYLGVPIGLREHRMVSEETAQLIDGEVRRILAEQMGRAAAALESQRDTLEKLVALLLDKETVGREDLVALSHPSEAADR